jgi:hypothetical protein
MKFSYFAFLAVATAALTACGGGGGDAPSAVQAPALASSGAVYTGTWVLQCLPDGEVKILTSVTGTTPITTKAAYRITTLKNLIASSSTVTGQNEEQYFDNSTCSGTAKDKQTLNFSFTIDGKATVDSKTVDKVTVTDTAIGGLSAGSTITINGVVYPGNYFTRTSVYKDIFLVEGTKWSVGDSAPAGQYPTSLITAAFFTKQ